ncbi:MAG: cell division protein ZapA [Flavobacteriaceae bacterium]|jgi:cell division protein ZapA|nr:cell division protein ZapA [Flavobacteriaceae bacterium]MDG0967599.1 cell division protein ZapA [Flavobacteriaceae bacterium]
MQKIKITIADRVYPLSVTEGQEAFLRNSAKQIEQMMKHYEQNYAVQDKQDVLAMCALQLALQLRQKESKTTETSEEIEKKLRTIDNLLSEMM